MRILRDEELVSLYKSHLIITNNPQPSDWFGECSTVQPSSIDLTVGDIYIPETDLANDSIANRNPVDSRSVAAGETVLVQSEEEIDVPNDHMVFGFPVASMSSDGMLMTNPGVVDPGFKGKLSFTLINMGRQPYPLRKGQPVFTTIWVQFDNPVKAGYSKRYGTTDSMRYIKKRLSHLPKDFLNIDSRAKKQATKVLAAATFIATIVSVVLPLAIDKISSDDKAINKKITKQEKELVEIKNKIAYLEGKVSTFSSTTKSDLKGTKTP